MRAIFTTAIVAFSLIGCATNAQKAQAQRWKDADIDGNDEMTVAEFEASKLGTVMSFDAVDQNEDGVITLDEYRHYNKSLRSGTRDGTRKRRNRY